MVTRVTRKRTRILIKKECSKFKIIIFILLLVDTLQTKRTLKT